MASGDGRKERKDGPTVIRKKDIHSCPEYGVCISASAEPFPSIIVEFPIMPSSGFPPPMGKPPPGGPPPSGPGGGGSSGGGGGSEPITVEPNPHWMRVRARPACEP